jgi:hypothetical protein
MARNSPSGKGRGGFASGLTRRARKHKIVVKRQNRERNISNKQKGL